MVEPDPTPCARSPVTRLIALANSGDGAAVDQLFPAVYDELRRLARRRIAGERGGHTLQATALVHEAYLKLVGAEHLSFAGRKQFFFAAAEAMRRILIDHARRHAGRKRGGGRKRVTLTGLELPAEGQAPEILALDEAVSRLEKRAPDVAEVVRLRFYAGLSVEETAEALGVSPRTVKRDWKYARAMLFHELSRDDP